MATETLFGLFDEVDSAADRARVRKQSQERSALLKRLAPKIDAPLGRPTKEEWAEIDRHNLAIWRLMNGHGSILKEIAVLTGLSERSIERRVIRAERKFTDDELRDYDGSLTNSELRYIGDRYLKSKDPAVREFAAWVTKRD